jgi:uncharacterized membrane protein
MKSIVDFIKSTLIGGFFVILPMLIIYLLLKEAFGVVIALASPVIDLMPASWMEEGLAPQLLALLLLVLISFILGVVLRYSLAQKLVEGFEEKLLNKLPGYTIIRSLTRRFSGQEDDEAFRPALMAMPMDSQAVVFVIEEHANGEYTVLVPASPTPGVGNILIVPAERIQLLDSSTAAVFDALSRWGEGLQGILNKKA